MITFDKLKIVTDIDDIAEINTSAFVMHTKDGEILYYKYNQTSPYELLIIADYHKRELVIEFTGKILLDDYPQLINRNSIRECFDNINRLGICRLDTDAIMEHGIVNKCDVTRDVHSGQMMDIIKQMKRNIVNYAKWNCDKYEGNGIVIYKTVKTPRCKERLCIYDKSNEMGKACNREFMNSIADKEYMLGRFRDKIRFELNINTSRQIRELLEIPDNKLLTVLSAKTNPILTVFDEAIKNNVPIAHCSSFKERMMASLIRECGNDLEKVEVEVRNCSSECSSVKRRMDQIRAVYAKMQQGEFNPVDVRSLIA